MSIDKSKNGGVEKWVLDKTLILSQKRKSSVYKNLMEERRDEYWQKFTYAEMLGLLEKSKGGVKRLQRFVECCNLQFKNIHNWKLKYANYCGNSTFCLACAWRRAYNNAKKIVQWVPSSWIVKKYWYMITFTIHHKEHHSLDEVMAFIIYAREYLIKRRYNCIHNNLKTQSFFAQFDGMAFSLEVTKNGKNWFHPHLHALVCTDNPDIIEKVTMRERNENDGWFMDSNREAILERIWFVKDGMHKYKLEKHLEELEMFKEYRIWYIGNYEEALPYLTWITRKSYRWIQIIPIEVDKLLDNRKHGRSALGEVFKYAVKMSEMTIENILEVALCLRRNKYKLLTMVWAFRNLKVKKKEMNKFEPAIIKPYKWSKWDGTYNRLSHNEAKNKPYRIK